jgi:hypothetical protein
VQFGQVRYITFDITHLFQPLWLNRNRGKWKKELKPMMKSYLAALFLFICVPVFAGEPPVPLTQAESLATAQPSNLTLSNFFTEGWNQEWTHRYTPGGAPDMALLHVTTNFLEREFRFDFYSQRNKGSNSTGDVEFADALVAYGLNRRFMLEVVGNYELDNARSFGSSSAGAAALVGRVQLVDVPGSSLAFNLKVTSPYEGLTDKGTAKATTIFPALAGWQDLTCYGLKKVGFYYSIGPDTFAGPVNPGEKHNDLAYTVALAKTWTERDVPLYGNFTTFVEWYAVTNLDGDRTDSTTFNMTPGIRLHLTHNNVLIAGVDVPVASPHAFYETFRLTYIYDFE